MADEDDALSEQLKEFRRILTDDDMTDYEIGRQGKGRRIEDYTWRRWVAERGQRLFALVSVLLLMIGALGGRLLGNELADKAEFRKAQTDLQRWVSNLDSRVQSIEQALPRYGDDATRALRLMEDQYRENLQFWKSAAEDRGDSATVRRLDRKLKSLAPSPPPEEEKP